MTRRFVALIAFASLILSSAGCGGSQDAPAVEAPQELAVEVQPPEVEVTPET